MSEQPFEFHQLLPLGADDTPYRKLTDDFVDTVDFDGGELLKVDPEGLSLLAAEAFRDINHLLRPGHLAQLKTILDDPEASDNDRFVAYDMLKNANIAAGGVLPMCQDTGTAIIMGKKGQRVWTGGGDEGALARGVHRTYTETNLRYSQVSPVSMYEETNTRTNLPAQIEIYAEDGDAYKFLFIAKGGGSANKSFLYQETPARLQRSRSLDREELQGQGLRIGHTKGAGLAAAVEKDDHGPQRGEVLGSTEGCGYKELVLEPVALEFLHVRRGSGRRNEGGARFRSGECAFFTESSAGYAGVKAEAEFAFDIRALPYWSSVEGAPQNTIIGGASLWVMSGHEDEEYAGVAEFLNFLSSADIQANWHQNTGYLPITAAAYEQTKESGFYKENPGTDIAIIQMTGKAPTANSKGLRLGNFDQIRGIIDEELEAVWAGDKDAKTALDSAVERGNQLLRRFEQANR